MDKVLVTGANGFVGGHLLKELHEHGIAVHAIGGSQGMESAPPFANVYQRLNLLDPADVHRIDFTQITGVIHLAGLAAVGPSFDNPMEYVTTNIGIEANLFEEALRQRVRPRFLVISSGSLYDPQAPLPLTETSRVIPSSPYAVSKLGQEQLAQYYGLRGFECIIARPFNHIGPGQSLGFIVPDLAKQVVEAAGGKVERVQVGNLDAQRDYTDVRDIARAYRLLVEKGIAGETYNICTGKPVSGHDILGAIEAAAGATPPVEQDAARMRPSDNPVLYGDHAKITNDTGWKPKIPLEVTIKDVVADWRQRLDAGQ